MNHSKNSILIMKKFGAKGMQRKRIGLSNFQAWVILLRDE